MVGNNRPETPKISFAISYKGLFSAYLNEFGIAKGDR
jgi:hypothetical protein